MVTEYAAAVSGTITLLLLLIAILTIFVYYLYDSRDLSETNSGMVKQSTVFKNVTVDLSKRNIISTESNTTQYNINPSMRNFTLTYLIIVLAILGALLFFNQRRLWRNAELRKLGNIENLQTELEKLKNDMQIFLKEMQNKKQERDDKKKEGNDNVSSQETV